VYLDYFWIAGFNLLIGSQLPMQTFEFSDDLISTSKHGVNVCILDSFWRIIFICHARYIMFFWKRFFKLSVFLSSARTAFQKLGFCCNLFSMLSCNHVI